MENRIRCYFVFLIGMMISGCGTFYKPPGLYSHLDFKSYANAYLQYKLIYLEDDSFSYPIEIEYGHLDGYTIGQCRKHVGRYVTRKIIIDQTYWNKASDDQRLNLIFHELAHCDLNCSHQEEFLGIMNADTTIREFDEDYVEQLFLTECR